MPRTIKNIEELFRLADDGKTLMAEMTFSPDDIRSIFHNSEIKTEFIHQDKVTRYANIMRAGNWECNSSTEPITFGKGNVLLDGLQRLCAVLFYNGKIKFNICINDECEVSHE